MKMMVALSAVAVALEGKAQPYIAAALGERMPAATQLALPAAYAGVVLVNVVAASFALIKLGMAVGKARKQYKVEVSPSAALRTGAAADARRARQYPTMYAAGTSKDALAFNCVQRGHQQVRRGVAPPERPAATPASRLRPGAQLRAPRRLTRRLRTCAGA